MHGVVGIEYIKAREGTRRPVLTTGVHLFLFISSDVPSGSNMITSQGSGGDCDNNRVQTRDRLKYRVDDPSAYQPGRQ
jgi:hypothetical protein